MTGMSAIASSRRITRIASSPDMPGIITSSTARSGLYSRQASTAAAPSLTAMISWPRVDSLNSTSSRMSTSSSATRILATATPSRNGGTCRKTSGRASGAGEGGPFMRPAFTRRSVVLARRGGGRLLDLHEELDVALRLLQPLEQQLEGLLAVESREHPAKLPDDLELLLAHQELLATGAGLHGIDRREQPLVGE